MEKYTRTILIALSILISMASCRKAPELPMQVLDLDQDVIIAPYMGSDYALTVNSNTAWKVDWSSSDWAIPDMDEYVGSSGVKLTVAKNTGGERATSLVFSTEDGQITRKVKVVQAGVSSDGYLSIAVLRSMEKAGESVSLSGTSEKIKGFVISDAVSGNWFPGSVAIEDSFSDEESGIVVRVEDGFRSVARGYELSVHLDGAVLERDESGFLVLSVDLMPETTHTTQVNLVPKKVGMSELHSGKYEAMYVNVTDVQVVEENIGDVWSMNPQFQDKDDMRMEVVVMEDASFASETFNEGAGSVGGIAGPLSSVPALYPAILDDIDLSTMRIGVNPGLRSLPYVFPFYCYEQTNGTPKYISYTNLTYDASTHLVKGVVARDIDESKGVFLEMTAYGKEVGNIFGPNYWAEQGAHDNINISGFVSLDNGKTVPTEECGFWLTVPLQMEMPADFNVSFGLCGAGDYTLSDWAVSYSSDKKEWQEAGRVRIERTTSGGSYYFYYTVPVHMTAPLPPESSLYLKFTPQGSRAINGVTTADGHGNSCRLRFHSAIVISQEVEGDTRTPSGAVYFQPFDKLTAGMDYFIGERLGAFANYCAGDISSWEDGKSQGMTGSNVMERPGYAQIGYVNTETPSSREQYTNEPGVLETPPVGVSGDFSLSFKAAAYRTPAIRPNADTGTPDVGSPDITEIIVEVLNGGTVEGKTSMTVTGLPTDRFGQFILNLESVTPQTKIRFTSAPVEGQFSRWFIDDILIK